MKRLDLMKSLENFDPEVSDNHAYKNSQIRNWNQINTKIENLGTVKAASVKEKSAVYTFRKYRIYFATTTFTFFVLVSVMLLRPLKNPDSLTRTNLEKLQFAASNTIKLNEKTVGQKNILHTSYTLIFGPAAKNIDKKDLAISEPVFIPSDNININKNINIDLYSTEGKFKSVAKQEANLLNFKVETASQSIEYLNQKDNNKSASKTIFKEGSDNVVSKGGFDMTLLESIVKWYQDNTLTDNIENYKTDGNKTFVTIKSGMNGITNRQFLEISDNKIKILKTTASNKEGLVYEIKPEVSQTIAYNEDLFNTTEIAGLGLIEYDYNKPAADLKNVTELIYTQNGKTYINFAKIKTLDDVSTALTTLSRYKGLPLTKAEIEEAYNLDWNDPKILELGRKIVENTDNINVYHEIYKEEVVSVEANKNISRTTSGELYNLPEFDIKKPYTFDTYSTELYHKKIERQGNFINSISINTPLKHEIYYPYTAYGNNDNDKVEIKNIPSYSNFPQSFKHIITGYYFNLPNLGKSYFSSTIENFPNSKIEITDIKLSQDKINIKIKTQLDTKVPSKFDITEYEIYKDKLLTRSIEDYDSKGRLGLRETLVTYEVLPYDPKYFEITEVDVSKIGGIK
jgi:hypothetical protein